jgi:hypothetical protein
MSEDVLAWHFVGDALRDGRPIPADGVTLKHKGKLELCASGLHASERLIDALNYAPGPILCRVQMGGTIKKESDKLVARQRTILWRVNSTDVLRKFARQCALDVAHLWNMPPVVRQYLETGDENLRAAAKAAASDAARAAASDAARAAASAAASDAARAAASAAAKYAASAAAKYAARDAASAAAWAAAWDAARAAARAAASAAARDAAWDAAKDAARDAAWDAAWAAAWDAAWDAAKDAARDAAWDAAWAAAWDAAWDAQNTRLTEMVMALAPEGS